MSLSLFARKAAVCWSIAGCCTTLLVAQTAYPPLGNESQPAGILPGDQAHPQLSISSKGGFLVWEDNATDESGLGIRAVGLDTHLQAVQAPMRVNFEGAGDQERPQVALLKDGGAVFAWKGGAFGRQKVYARFLGADNNWVTGDLLVSAPGNSVQRGAGEAPSIAVLTNGNVVVVWSAFNQRASTSMDDVYGQLLSPSGVKIGAPFAINAYSSYNQRTPAVAALPNGGFVVSWISEQQRRLARATTNEFIGPEPFASVDVYARVYDRNAAARGTEFLVSTNGQLSANPAVAAAEDSSFIVAWSKGEANNMTNDWDVLARSYSSIAVGGPVEVVNSRVRGAQFRPAIAAVTNDFLITWVSMTQDGSREGVFGQFVTKDLQPIGEEFKVNATVRMTQDQQTVAADNSGRFVAAWRTTQLQERLAIEVCSQTYAMPGFQPLDLATNYLAPVFVGPTNGGPIITNIVSNLPTLPFPETPSSGGSIPVDGFARYQGLYRGLLYNTNGVSATDSGYVSIRTGDSGRYTANFKVGTRSYAFSGQFDAEGNAVKEIPRGASLSPINVRLHIDLLGADQVSGSFTIGPATSEFLADRQVYGLANRCPVSGRYNIVISAPESESAGPEGYGYGTALVYADGKVLLSAKLADGTIITQNTGVSKNGVWPLYAAPYSTKGVVLGWIQVADSAANGGLIWIKPALKTKYYPAGFAGTATLTGTAYKQPTLGKRALDLQDGNGAMVFTGTCLGGSISSSVSIDMRNKVVDTGTGGVRVLLNSQNGTFQGSFPISGKTQRVLFNGKLLQGENFGAGFFLYNNVSGQVYLSSPVQ